MKHFSDSRVRCPEEFMNRREQTKRSSVQMNSPLPLLTPVPTFQEENWLEAATILSEARKVVS